MLSNLSRGNSATAARQIVRAGRLLLRNQTDALLEEGSLGRDADESDEACDRRMLLADARARGLLPPEDEEIV